MKRRVKKKVEEMFRGAVWILFFTNVCEGAGNGYVTSVTPHYGSLNGETRITIYGSGFSADQFTQNDDPNVGNKVYLVSDSDQEYPCQVFLDGCTEKQITCFTLKGMKTKDHYVKIVVDGEAFEDEQLCGGNPTSPDCTYKPHPDNTPTIESITPPSGKMGETMITMTGLFFTDRYGSNVAKATNGKEQKLLRVYVGPKGCEVKNDADAFYGFALDSADSNHGTLKCKTMGTSTGCFNASIIVEPPYGRSLSQVQRVMENDDICMFTSYTDITSISHANGSQEGGLLQTICGNNFDDTPPYSLPRAYVGDTECVIREVVVDGCITCEVAPDPESTDSSFPGNRGAIFEYWQNTQINDISNIDSVRTLTSSQPGYNKTIIDETYFFDVNNTMDNYASRMRTYYSPLHDGDYQFFLYADDGGKLFIDDEAVITSEQAWAESSIRTLERNRRYLLEVVHFETNLTSVVHLKVKYFNTSYTSASTNQALQERQAIVITSTVTFEEQEVEFKRFSGQTAVGEKQTVQVNTTGQFRLGMYGVYTVPLTTTTDEDMIKDAIEALPIFSSDDSISVVRKQVQNPTFEIVISSPLGNYPNFDVVKVLDNPPVQYTVTEDTAGVPDLDMAALSFAGAVSDPFSVSSLDASSLQSAANSLFEAKCPQVFLPSTTTTKYKQDFESDSPSVQYGGRRVKDTEPFCGRYSLMDPYRIYKKRDEDSDIMLSLYGKLCFAYKGYLQNYIRVTFSYKASASSPIESETRNIGHDFETDSDTESVTWYYTCVNVYDAVKAIYPNIVQERLLEVKVYSLNDEKSGYVDAVVIGQDDTTDDPEPNRLRLAPAKPNGALIQEATASLVSGTKYKITLKPYECGTGFPLFGIANGAVTAGQLSYPSSSVTQKLHNGNGVFTAISRSRASPETSGVLDLRFKGVTKTNLNISSEAADFGRDLESLNGIGSLWVTRDGDCANFNVTVTFLTLPGDQEQMQVSTSSLSGSQPQVSIVTEENGGLFYDPIPGGIVRTVESTPQVRLYINDILTACSGDCSFQWLSAKTPTVTSTAPTEGTLNTSIVIGGTGFDTDKTKNTVTIGNVTCTVTASTATSITCYAGNGPVGEQKVMVNVDGKGHAKHSSGNMMFEYTAGISGIAPTSGSLGGGINLTVSGHGFKEGLSVTINSVACPVISTEPSKIVCIVPPKVNNARRRRRRSGGTYNVEVTYGSTNLQYPGFEYSTSLTAIISSVTPSTISVIGGRLTISGESFTTNAGTVYVGPVEAAIVSWTDSQIVADVKGVPAGTHNLLVMAQYGHATDSSWYLPDIYADLTVLNVFPTQGSILGGTKLTVTGTGFGTNDTIVDVSVGGVECDVETVTDTEIVCEIGYAGTNYYVTNQGISQEFGKGYAFDNPYVNIQAGDTVHWSWETGLFVDGVAHSIIEVEYPSAKVAKDGGFRSASSSHGSYSRQFPTVGVFYVWSGFVDAYRIKSYIGTINVQSATSRLGEISVKVADIEALYTIEGADDPSDTSQCQATTTVISPCSDSLPTGGNSNKFNFAYRTCSTPTVSSIDVSNATVKTSITISGKGLSTSKCQNEVSFGDNSCTVNSLNASSVTCTLSKSGEPDLSVLHRLAVKVRNRGNALIEIKPTAALQIVPNIERISPTAGSLAGGAHVTMTGFGFGDSPLVEIGGVTSNILYSSNTEIICESPASTAESERDIEVKAYFDGNPQVAKCETETKTCKYTYANAYTPTVTASEPDTILGPTTVTITGTSLGTEQTVAIGGVNATVTFVNATLLKAYIANVPVGVNDIIVRVKTYGKALGNLKINGAPVINSPIVPSSGSIHGGTVITINGNGFVTNHTNVTLGDSLCTIISTTLSKITCETKPHAAASVSVNVTSNGISYPTASYSFSADSTPTITTLDPQSGIAGNTLTISGLNLNGGQVNVSLDGADCSVTNSSSNQIKCTLGNHATGSVPVSVHVVGKGLSNADKNFVYTLSLSGISRNEGSLAGGQTLVVSGTGFDNSTVVTICDQTCTLITTTSSEYTCRTPSHTAQTCDVSVSLNGVVKTLENSYTYNAALTPTISGVTPTRGGTGGGTILSISGSGFGSPQSLKRSVVDDLSVMIDGAECEVSLATDTEIECMTGPHVGSLDTKVEVHKSGNGIAMEATSGDADFSYIDVWSSVYTWGGASLPEEGDFIVIPAGMTLLLDTDTPVLSFLLIQGGTLIFDEVDVELKSKVIMITDGGLLQVGTEAQPFQHKGIITLYGHPKNPELPIYGTKVLAVRNGTADLHGIEVPLTWTRLASTATAGSDTLELQHAVNWNVGDEVAIASTGSRHSQSENEKRTIAGISSDRRTLTLDSALGANHWGTLEEFDGTTVEFRAEVGLLTHNVVVRGNTNPQWEDEIEACPAGFDTGEFATQTCFQGRYGDEMGSDEFGAMILVHAPVYDTHEAQARLSYIEMTHVGQAHRLGRYPIHFHLNGDMSTSYVRGCGIHKSFNRAVNNHGTHNTLVEWTVIYDIMGGAFFFEDGIETGNVIQYNLAVFVRASSSLLNDDITPAAYWVTNPNNTIRHNAAAGGTHFGYWYRMHDHPGGPSYTNTTCPKATPLGEFRNNSAHSLGWFGLWIFPDYHPKKVPCGGTEVEPAVFGGLSAWNCEKGAEFVNSGALQLTDSVLVQNQKAGYEGKMVDGAVRYTDSGPLIKDSLIVARTTAIPDSEQGWTRGGIIFPYGTGFRAVNTRFVHFADSSCAALRWTSIDGTCGHLCGGYTYHTEGLSFVNSPQKGVYRWESEGTIYDKDGTATGNANWAIVPTTGIQPPDCVDAPDFSLGIPASMCPPPYNEWRRFSFNNVLPQSLEGMNFLTTNQFGTSSHPFAEKRITHKLGWSLSLLVGTTYKYQFEHGEQIHNFSFSGIFEDFGENDYVIFEGEFQLKPDKVSFDGGETDNNETEGGIDSDSNHGDWSWDSTTNKMKFMVRGHETIRDRHVSFTAYKCYYENCIPPPDLDTLAPATERPDDFVIWDNTTLWNNSTNDSYVSNTGGSYGIPEDNNDVRIASDTWVVVNKTTTFNKLGKLLLEGVLEFLDTPGAVYEIDADFIIIKGGRLIIGWPDDEFDGLATIMLRGNHSSPYYIPGEGPVLGSKAIGVFGGLDLFGKDVGLTWTELATTATAGSNTIVLADKVSWTTDDDIVIGPTGFDPWQTEARKIVSVASDNVTLTLNASLSYPHIAHYEILTNGQVLKFGAAVGLLSRRIKIVGEDYSRLYQESFGARVLVGLITQNGQAYTGYARLRNVEFYHTGQEGFTDTYDPRYSLAYLTTGTVSDVKPSFVSKCSFHNGFSTAIGAIGIGNLNITDNVIYGAIGDGLKTTSNATRLLHNLVVLVVSTVTYQNRYQVYDYESNSGIEALVATMPATSLILQENLVTGSERIAYHVPPLDYSDTSDRYRRNKAYANVLGGAVITYHDSVTETSYPKISGFTIWKTNGFGIYYQHEESVLIENNVLIENINGLFPIVLGPDPLKHEFANKYVQVRNTTFVGETISFDCRTDVTPPNDANYILSANARPSWLPNRGMAGLIFPGFYQSGNGLPTHPWIGIMSYPAIEGLMTLEDVVFAKYTSNECTRNYAASTNFANDDGMHPIESTGTSFIDSDKESLVYYHPPNVDKINSADCVDMDCDGKKKALIKDLDGTLLGHVGSVIPNSAFEWDGDSRHGLGDYRIPKSMLTNANGDRVNVDSIISHRGIIGNGNCTYRSSWRAFECPVDFNYEMLIIESMDDDTETRRLSPVALLGDRYIDLINGPQDHGWCSGYTCRLRLSTFMALVATGKEYLMHFTSKTPDNTRFRLLNVASNEGIKLKIWYASRSRLDVYVDGTFKQATNVELDSEGRYITRMAQGNEFEPQIANVTGTNLFDKDSGELALILKGPQRIDVETQQSVIVTFGLPDMTVEEFFGENIVGNLAAFLNIPADKIKVVNVVSASTGSRRRKRSTETGIEVEIEICDEPKPDENATVTFPIDYESLTEMAAIIVNECQVGNISELLNVTGNCVSVRIFPSDPEIAVIEYSAPTPDHLFFNEEPVSMYEGVPLQTQPKLRAADAMNNVVTELGTAEFPWQLTASLRPGTGHPDAVLTGNVSVTSSNGWFNFTNLIISHMGTGYILDFNVSYPSQANTFYIASNPFDVPGRSVKVHVFDQSDGNIVLSAPFSVTLDLQDLNTEEVVSDIAWRGHTWTAEASLLGSSPYAELGGLLTLTFDASTGRAMFPDLTMTGFGIYFIQFTVTSDPADYNLTLNHKVNIKHPSHVDMTVEETYELQVMFDEVFNELLTTEDKENEFEQMILSVFANLWPDIYIISGSIQEGSIVVTFVISGTYSSVNSTAYSMCDSIYNQTSYSFEGNSLTLSPYLTVNGEEYYGVKCGEITPDEQQETDEGMAAYLIAIIVIGSLLVVTAIVIIVIWRVFVNKSKSSTQVFVKPLGFNKKQAVTAKGSHYFGFSDKQMQDHLFHEKSFTSLKGGHLDSHAPPIATNAPPFSRNDNGSPFPRSPTGEHTLLTRIPQTHNIHVSELLGTGNTNYSTAWSTGSDLHMPHRMDQLEPRIPSPGGNASPMLHRALTPPVTEIEDQMPPVGDAELQDKRYF